MAAGPKLDGAGIQKMKTIDEATMQVQRLHGVVETYALALKRKQPTQLFSMQIKRQLSPLVGMLKPQFGMIADQVAAMNLVAGRGGNEMTKLRILREGIGSLKQALEIAAVRVKENHMVVEEPEAPKSASH
ncbi:MAG TPA: hypothetical protein VFI52_17300 [Gemmatimonadaceae bacterium]|nr:hypothetical protein [Gemmatimonadaceae bacterium]